MDAYVNFTFDQFYIHHSPIIVRFQMNSKGSKLLFYSNNNTPNTMDQVNYINGTNYLYIKIGNFVYYYDATNDYISLLNQQNNNNPNGFIVFKDFIYDLSLNSYISQTLDTSNIIQFQFGPNNSINKISKPNNIYGILTSSSVINNSVYDYYTSNINNNSMQSIFYFTIISGDNIKRNTEFVYNNSIIINDNSTIDGSQPITHRIYIALDYNDYLIITINKSSWYLAYMTNINGKMLLKYPMAQGLFN